MQRLGLIVQQLQDIAPLAGMTELGKSINKMIELALKHVPTGGTSPAAQKNNIESLAMRNAQQGMASRQLAEQRAKQMQGGGQQQPMGAAA